MDLWYLVRYRDLTIVIDHFTQGTHFTNDFFRTSWIRLKFRFAIVKIPAHYIATNVCTCHNSLAVVTCATFCSDRFVRILMGATSCEVFIQYESSVNDPSAKNVFDEENFAMIVIYMQIETGITGKGSGYFGAKNIGIGVFRGRLMKCRGRRKESDQVRSCSCLLLFMLRRGGRVRKLLIK